jgi:hypothetical protein
MDYLEFRGSITTNSRAYHKLVFPDSGDAPDVPADWPGSKLYRGSLNVTVDIEGFPANWQDLGTQPLVKRFDDKRFKPEFVIPGTAIENNTRTPETTGIPDGGDAQVWRATLRVDETGDEIDCWLVRRIGSGVARYLELVSEFYLRERMALRDGTKVTVIVAGTLTV